MCDSNSFSKFSSSKFSKSFTLMLTKMIALPFAYTSKLKLTKLVIYELMALNFPKIDQDFALFVGIIAILKIL